MAKRKQFFFYKTVARYFDVITQKSQQFVQNSQILRYLADLSKESLCLQKYGNDILLGFPNIAGKNTLYEFIFSICIFCKQLQNHWYCSKTDSDIFFVFLKI